MNSLKSQEIVTINLYPVADSYLIGEPVKVKMQIINHSPGKLTFPGFRFDWEELSFSPPNRVSLKNPSNIELAAPYEAGSSHTVPAPIVVPANNEEWFYLPLYTYFFFTKEGKYTFSIALEDKKKRVFCSPAVNFNLKTDITLVSPDKLDLELEPADKVAKAGETISLNAVFINNSDKTCTFLKPQQDSCSGWVNPVYQFIVKDKKQRILPVALRDGSMAEPVYDAAHMFSLSPGSRETLPLSLPPFPHMTSPGEYEIFLVYLVRKKQIGKNGTVLDEDMSWNPDIFTGRIISGPLTLQIIK